MAPPKRPKGRKDSATAEKTKTPQLATAGPLKLTEKLLATVQSVEQLLKLAREICKLYRLALEFLEQIKEIFL